MAKKRSTRRGKRDTRRYHSPQRFDPVLSPNYDPDRYVFTFKKAPEPVWEITQDARFYTPRRTRSRRVDGKAARVIPVGDPPAADLYQPLTAQIGFEAPQKVITCVRRKARREVIFASGRAGGGSRKPTSRRNSESKIRC